MAPRAFRCRKTRRCRWKSGQAAAWQLWEGLEKHRAGLWPEEAPGDQAKVEEAVRRLRGAEVLQLHLSYAGLGGRARGVGCG